MSFLRGPSGRNSRPRGGWARWHLARRLILGPTWLAAYAVLAPFVLLGGLVWFLVDATLVLIKGDSRSGSRPPYIITFFINFTTTLNWTLTGHADIKLNPFES